VSVHESFTACMVFIRGQRRFNVISEVRLRDNSTPIAEAL